MVQQLNELLRCCTVKITIPGSGGWGTGFFVVPGLILTCAHVVKAASANSVTVFYPEQKQSYPAILESFPEANEHVDLVLLRLQDAIPAHPCVYLDEAIALNDRLYSYGYPDDFAEGAFTTFESEALTGGNSFIKFKAGQVRPGMSGSPLLNQSTGKVCGIVKFTRDRLIDLGGGAIPTHVILEQFPQLRELQQQFHGGDRRWSNLVKKQSEIDFQTYLAAITSTYEKWWKLYTLTDAEGRQQESKDASPIFDFGLMVQMVKKEEHEQQEQQKIEHFPVLEGIRKYAEQHVLLVGRPGSGKSTALARLLLEEATTNRARIPVLVELRYWQGSLSDLIHNSITRYDSALKALSLDPLLADALLLFDGVNELPSEEARAQLSSFRRNYPKLPMIFTTRDLGLGGDLGIEKKLEMQPLTETQMKEFIRAYVPKQADAMLRQLSDRLREFGQTPLLLWMLCEVFQQTPNHQLPSNLAGVFQTFTTVYENQSIRKYEVAALKGDVRPLSDRRLWKKALKALASAMMQGETPVDFRVVMSRDEAEQELSRIFPTEPFLVRDILDDLLKYHLLQHRSTDQIEFRHQLIQEYYAAEYLLRLLPNLNDEQLKRDYLNYLKWTEPLALMLAMVDEKTQALRVVKLAMDEVDLMLGARLAGEVKPVFQATTVSWLDALEIPPVLQCKSWATSHSEQAIPRLLQAREDKDFRVHRSAVNALEQLGIVEAIDELPKALEHQDYSVSGSTAEVLGQIESGRTIPGISIFENLSSNDRMRATDILGQLDSEEVIPGLTKLLKEPDLDIRKSATDILGQLSSKAAIPGLLISLEDPNFDIRMSAAESLAKRGSEQAIPVLFNALGHEDYYVRWKAQVALRQLGTEAVIKELLVALEHASGNVRRSATEILGNLGSEAAISGLLTALKSSDHRIRGSAAWALQQPGNKAAIPGLLTALEDPDSNVRESAAWVLGALGDKVAIPRLLTTLEDSDHLVRRSTAWALAQLGSDQAIPELLKALKHENSDVRENAANALGKLSNKVAIPGLLTVLEDPDSNVRESAAWALAQLGSDQAIPELLEILEDAEPDTRSAVADALGQIGTKEAIDELLFILEDSDYFVRWQAVLALGRIGTEAAIDGLLIAIQDPEPDVYEYAAESLTKIGSPLPLKVLWQVCLKGKVQILSTITAIQNRCKYYNHEIAHGILPAGESIALYFSYAPTDADLQNQLANHLNLLERQGVITSWHHRKMLPGDERVQSINDRLNTADIILLLISADSIADHTCYDIEISRAMERHQAGEARVIPILLRPVDWTGAPFSQLPVLPKNHQPVTTWHNQDAAFQEIAEGIREVAIELRRMKGEE